MKSIFLYNVYHITAPTWYLHMEYFTRLYPKAVRKRNKPNFPSVITRTKKWGTMRPWAENHAKPPPPPSVVICTSTSKTSMHMQSSIHRKTEVQYNMPRPCDITPWSGYNLPHYFHVADNSLYLCQNLKCLYLTSQDCDCIMLSAKTWTWCYTDVRTRTLG